VDVEVTINPAIPQGMTGTLDLKVYDPDNALDDGALDTSADGDPDAFDGKEHPDDNYGPSLVFASDKLTFTAEMTSQRTTATLGDDARQPGNNYIVAVSGDMAGTANHYYFDDEAVTLVHDDVADSGGGSGGASAPLPPNLQTPKLTVWRTLWVERDSMGDPDTQSDPDKKGGFGGNTGDIEFVPHLPDMSMMAAAYSQACVTVRPVNVGDPPDDELEFQHYLDFWDEQNQQPEMDAINYGLDARNVESWSDFWTIQVIGAYEAGPSDQSKWDYDGETDYPALGYTFIHSNGGPIFIFEETIRDAAAAYPGAEDDKTVLEQIVVLHESLHCFLGLHSSDPVQDPSDFGADEGVMARSAITGEGIELTHRQLRYIQTKEKYNP
jgi:hypothetical protein